MVAAHGYAKDPKGISFLIAKLSLDDLKQFLDFENEKNQRFPPTRRISAEVGSPNLAKNPSQNDVSIDRARVRPRRDL